jgi:homoserine dehydrogenase
VFQYARLRELQRQSYTHYFYEATVGAGLPIISSLRGLLETGDRIVKVEGIFRSARVNLALLVFSRCLYYEDAKFFEIADDLAVFFDGGYFDAAVL